MTTVGSLCIGYGGLELALDAVLEDTELAWVSEIEPNAVKVIEARYPDTPNLGDLTLVDWQNAAPVDVLTAGYPCQPFSHAGQRLGEADERHLWPHISDAIGALRPRLVVLENVAGHVSLGGPTVVSGLAALRYDARWMVIRASDVGACHGRARWFCVARDTESAEWRPINEPRRRPSEGQNSQGQATSRLGEPSEAPAPDASSERRQQDGGSPHSEETQARGGSRRDVPFGDDAPSGRDRRMVEPATSDSDDSGRVEHRRAVPTPTQHAAVKHRGQDAPDSDLGRCEQRDKDERRLPVPSASSSYAGDFGPFAAAIRRHEQVLGRAAPPPVDAKDRLSPLFVEWMMMLPAGWLTDIITARTAALRLLGNGVVPPQAAAALQLLLEATFATEVAA